VNEIKPTTAQKSSEAVVRRYVVYRKSAVVLRTDLANEAMLEFLKAGDEDGTARLYDNKIRENIAWNESA